MIETITQRTIKQLKAPSQGKNLIWDRELKGFGVQVRVRVSTRVNAK